MSNENCKGKCKFKECFSKIANKLSCCKKSCQQGDCSTEICDPIERRKRKICTLGIVAISASVVAVNNFFFIDKKIAKHIENNPKEIISSIEKMYKQKAEETEKESEKEAVALYPELVKNIPSIGNKNAPYHVVEFFDYKCGHCKSQAEELNKLIKTGKFQVHLAHYPILSQESQIAAYVALKVQAKHPAKYEEFHNRLIASKASIEDIKSILVSMGMPELAKEKTLVDKNDKEGFEKLQAHYEYGSSKLKIQGTPFLIVSGESGKVKVLKGKSSKEEIEAISSK